MDSPQLSFRGAYLEISPEKRGEMTIQKELPDEEVSDEDRRESVLSVVCLSVASSPTTASGAGIGRRLGGGAVVGVLGAGLLLGDDVILIANNDSW